MKKTPYKGNYKVLPEQHKSIAQLYDSGKYTTEYIAKTYNISTRQVQRIAKSRGVIRTNAEANKSAAPLKHYYSVPQHLRVQRKQLSNKLRYKLINDSPFCCVCGFTIGDGIRLEVDHIDNNPMNNDLTNLQVLCNLCNKGKSDLDRFPTQLS
jgi:5-methylcytosine-specific restriction endonuclease McrA